jgi:glycine cleavage system H lipoate-binding protein
MQAIVQTLEAVGVFLAGLVGRMGIFLVMVAVVAVPALVVAIGLRWAERRRRAALGLREVGGLQFRPGVRYAKGHTWLAPRNGGALAVGIDDLAERILTSVTAIELPRSGSAVRTGEILATLHGGGRAVRILSPVNGIVMGVNGAVVRDPGLVKRDGYGRGWLVAVAPSDDAWQALPQGPEAETFLLGESARFQRFLEERLGFAAADGGALVAPAPWLVGEKGWQQLTAEFLGA